MPEALMKMETSLEKLEKGGRGGPPVQEAPEAPADDGELAQGEKRAPGSDQEHASLGDRGRTPL
jgi:hypothetical protein